MTSAAAYSELDAALAKLQQIRELHQPIPVMRMAKRQMGASYVCPACRGTSYPCHTMLILDGPCV